MKNISGFLPVVVLAIQVVLVLLAQLAVLALIQVMLTCFKKHVVI
jgi:hypothetical protein